MTRGGARAGSGRPRKPLGTRRERVTITLEPFTLLLLDIEAEERDVSRSAVVNDLLSGALFRLGRDRVLDHPSLSDP